MTSTTYYLGNYLFRFSLITREQSQSEGICFRQFFEDKNVKKSVLVITENTDYEYNFTRFSEAF